MITFPIDLSKISNIVNNNFLKRTVCDKLATNNHKLVTVLQRQLMMLSRKYLMLVDLLKKTDYNNKTTETQDKIPTSITKNSYYFCF